MLKKIINFIKYHNAFLIIVAFVFVATISVMAADEEIRDKVLGEKIVSKSGIDNSQILNVDLEEFDLGMKITDVQEDDQNYYLTYQFKTYGVKNNIWQVVLKQEELEISKKSLAGRDLGIYATEELGEVIDYELAYLGKVQKSEIKAGEKLVEETTEYKGLLGLAINTKTKELPATYKLVVEPAEIEYEEDQPSQPELPTPPVYIPPEVMPDECNSSHLDLCVTEELCREKGLHWYGEQCNDSGPTLDSVFCQNQKELCSETVLSWCSQECEVEEEEDEDDEEEEEEEYSICDLDNLDLCDTQDLCEGIDLHWYGDVCNTEEEIIIPDPICDLDNLDLCDTQDLCEGIDLHWYGDVCNTEEEEEVEEEDEEEEEEEV